MRLQSQIVVQNSTTVSDDNGARLTGLAESGQSFTSSVTGMTAAISRPNKTSFYGITSLDPIMAKKQFADIVDEVLLQFTQRTGINVEISIEIRAESNVGFDDGVQRAVKENCNVLRFKNAEFE